METQEVKRSTLGWQCESVQMSGVNAFAGTQMQETKFAGRLARSVQAPPSTMSYAPDPTSRDGSCVARLNVEDVMRLKSRCDVSKQLRSSRGTADSLCIRVKSVQALETGCGARSATLTWSCTKA